MDRIRVILAILLSTIVLMGWPLITHYVFPPPPQPVLETVEPPEASKPAAEQPPSAAAKPPAAPAAAAPGVQVTQEPQRDVVVETPYWRARFSNRGAVATSWVIKKLKHSAIERELLAADGGPLELIPQEVIEQLGAPFNLRLPWSPELAEQINRANFKVEGAQAGEAAITLGPGERREITFTYYSPAGSARKTFTFYGDTFVVDVAAEVTAGGEPQPAYLVLGPRVGDQSEKRINDSYNTPPQVVAYNNLGEREAFLASYITPVFGKIVGVDAASNRIQIDKPLASDADRVKITNPDGTAYLGYARVMERESNGTLLTLDELPQGAAAGSGVAQGSDTVRHGYRWAGVVDHYFSMVAIPSLPAGEIVLTSAQMKRDAADDYQHDYPSVAVPVQPQSVTHVFVGPKDRELLAEVGSQFGTDLGALIDYGMFAWMIRPLIPAIGWALDGLARLFHNYGWSIVVVTVIINLALSPLRWFSSKKMKKAAKHQPRMKELQDRMKKLKENPKKYERELQQLQQEQIALMKEANPLGGCLPLLLQMPIFWAFFVYLTISLDVRHAPWLGWIKDLSVADPYYVLPIIMCVTMILSTKLTPQPASADPAMKMQRMMMTYLMPILLTWLFFFSAPSGLVLYWMVSNIVGVGIQLIINKATAEPPEAQAAAAASGKAEALGGKAGRKGDVGRKRKASEKEIVGGVK
jgi:YidC/Oxa1 family membrane protein insertase